MIAWLILAALAPQEAAPQARSRTVQAGGGPIEVVLPLSAPDRSFTAAVSFPGEALESLVVPWDETALSIERHGSNLFLKLLRPAEGDIHVVGSSGALHRIRLRQARPGEDYDARIVVERPQERAAPRVPAVELVRAMRLGRPPPGAAVRAARGTLLDSGGVEIAIRYVYDAGPYAGYVLAVRNRGEAPFRLDPSRFSAEGLVLVGARTMVVEAGGTGLLYLVFWK